jgi:hypothetical protein
VRERRGRGLLWSPGQALSGVWSWEDVWTSG